MVTNPRRSSLTTELERLGHDDLDAVGDLLGPCRVSHGTPSYGGEVRWLPTAQAVRHGRPRGPGAPRVAARPVELLRLPTSAGFSRISYVSMRSPIWRSLYAPRLMPHSKPSRTSVTSSLNRRRPAISTLSATTTPSRMIRAFVPRRISPVRTIEPAMLPNLLERKISRISAVPSSHLLELRLEHALQGRLDLLDRLVDHRVVADLDALALGDVGVLALGPDVEADDDRVRGHREVDVVQRDRADAAVDDPQVDLVAHVDLQQRVLEGLDRTGHVALEDEVERLDLARGEGLGEVLQARSACGPWPATPGGRRPHGARRSAGRCGRRGPPGRCHRRAGPRPGRAPAPDATGSPPARCCRARRAWRGRGRAPSRRRCRHRPAACRTGPAPWPPGHGRGRGWPRSRHRGRPCPGWRAGRAPRRRSAGRPRAGRRCSGPAGRRRRRTSCRRRTPRRPGCTRSAAGGSSPGWRLPCRSC